MVQSYRSPNSKVWQNVTLLEPFVNGSCRQIQCNSCEGVFAGNASRVRNHYTKCLSCPENLRKWAQEQEKLKQEIHSTKVEAKLFTAMIAQDGKVLQQQRIDKLFSAMIAQDDPSARIHLLLWGTEWRKRRE